MTRFVRRGSCNGSLSGQGEAKAEVLAITGLLADLAEQSVTEAMKALQHKPRSRRVGRMLDDLAVLIERTNRVIEQARTRVNGDQPDGATRLVSLHEPDARPIRKGRLGKPVEFGYKAQVVDNVDGIILDHSVHIGNPSDTGLLRPALERVTAQFGSAPVLVTADRGYWDSSIEADLTVAGVATVVIPRTGKPSQARAAIEHADTFIAAITWRTGCEDASHTSNAIGRGVAPDYAVTTERADCARCAVGLQAVHRPQPRFQPAVIALDSVVRILDRVVQCRRNNSWITFANAAVGHDLF